MLIMDNIDFTNSVDALDLPQNVPQKAYTEDSIEIDDEGDLSLLVWY